MGPMGMISFKHLLVLNHNIVNSLMSYTELKLFVESFLHIVLPLFKEQTFSIILLQQNRILGTKETNIVSKHVG